MLQEEDWRKLHNAEFPRRYSTANIIWGIQSRKVRWAENVARVGRREMHRVWWGNLKERDYLKDLVVDGG
jgi:hypothetical protein